MRFIVLDIETTGLSVPQGHTTGESGESGRHGKGRVPDEILQLAIVDQDGAVLFYDSFAPKKKRSWPKAQAVNHISPGDVAGKQSFSARLEEIQNIIDTFPVIVAYNAVFDLRFLQGQGINLSKKPYVCAMEAFARAFAKKKHHGRGHKWKPLATCAAFFGLTNENAHDALADAQLTLACYKAMTRDPRFRTQPQAWSTDL